MKLAKENYLGIVSALQVGMYLKAFRSGGGLMVVRIELPRDTGNPELMAYGEHPMLFEAMQHANDELVNENLTYEQKYGKDGKYTHYLTGSYDFESMIEQKILGGGRVFIYFEEETNQFVAKLETLSSDNNPKVIQDTVLYRKKLGDSSPFEWIKDGVIMESTPYQFANKEWGITTKVSDANDEEVKSGDVWMKEIDMIYKNTDFELLFDLFYCAETFKQTPFNLPEPVIE